MGIDRLFTDPDFGSEIVHGDVFETQSHEMVPRDGQDAMSDRIEILGLGDRKWVRVHTLRKLYEYFKFPPAVRAKFSRDQSCPGKQITLLPQEESGELGVTLTPGNRRGKSAPLYSVRKLTNTPNSFYLNL